MRLAILALLLTTGIAHGQEDLCPAYIIRGLVRCETRSYWDDQGKFHYVDRRDGTNGEAGCCQITPAAFEQVRKKGETFGRLRYDCGFSCEIALRYLAWLRKRCKSWEEAVGCYNTGLGGSPRIGNQYLLMVQLAAGIAP